MYSFYGGPNGQSFTITKIFSSKNGSSDSLVYDLSLNWASLITVGSFVVISYGKPDDDNYEMYKDIDLRAEGKVYNGTFWRKEYYEDLDDEDGGYRVRGVGGMSYRLVASLAGNTPRLLVGTTVLDANGTPSVVVDDDDPDMPHFQFSLPQAQLLLDDNVTCLALDANLLPYLSVDCESSNDRVNHPTLKFFIPQSQYITGAEVEAHLDVNLQPEVRLDSTGPNGTNRPVLKFKLPVAQRFTNEHIVTKKLDANKNPNVSMSGNINEPTLTFELPQSQIMGEPHTDTIGPAEEPDVLLDDSSINSPKLQFKLPRAVKFLYGSKLGTRTEGTYTLLGEQVAVGDYYINEATGFVYIVTLVLETGDATVSYVACLERPLPQVRASGISPFDASGTPVQPTVDRRFLNPEETQWELLFSLPKAPLVDATYNLIPSTLTGKVNVSKSETGVIFGFEIPVGTRMFSGSGVPSLIKDAKDGDFYFDMETGFVYQLSGSDWNKQEGKLQGPVGESLNIVASYRIEETSDNKDSLPNGAKYIVSQYQGDISSLNIFAVTWIAEETQVETAYWYFLPEGKDKNNFDDWGRVQLTGGTANLIETDYNPEALGPVENKTYSVHYINELIGKEDGDNTRTAYSKKQVDDKFTANQLEWGDIKNLLGG